MFELVRTSYNEYYKNDYEQWNDDIYELYYNNDILLVYDDDMYPSSISIEVDNVYKHVEIYIPVISEKKMI